MWSYYVVYGIIMVKNAAFSIDQFLMFCSDFYIELGKLLHNISFHLFWPSNCLNLAN